MMNPFDVAFEFIKAPYTSFDVTGNRADESGPFLEDESYNKLHMLNAQASILAQDPAIAVHSSFGQYATGVHGASHETTEKENQYTGRTEYTGVNYGLPYHRIVTNGKMQTDTLDKLRALGSTADREHGFSVHIKRLSNVYHDGEDWKHDNTGDRGHYQYSISPTESRLNEIADSPAVAQQAQGHDLFHNDISKRTEEEKMHRDWWSMDNREAQKKMLFNGSKNPYIFTEKQRNTPGFDIHDPENHPKNMHQARRIDANHFNDELPLGMNMGETARMISKKGKAGHKYGKHLTNSEYKRMTFAANNHHLPGMAKELDTLLKIAKFNKQRQWEKMYLKENPQYTNMSEEDLNQQYIRQLSLPEQKEELERLNEQEKKKENPINQSDTLVANRKREAAKEEAEEERQRAAEEAKRFKRIINNQNRPRNKRKGKMSAKERRQSAWKKKKSEPMNIAFQLLKAPVMPGRAGFPEDDPDYLSPNDQMWNDEADKDLEEKTNALWKYAEANGIDPELMFDTWHDRASFVEGLDYDGGKPDTGEMKFRAHAVDPSEWKKLASEPMNIAFQLLKERKSPEAFANKKKYDSEYQKTPKRVKYREQLNAERRKRGIYGKGGKDVSHTQGGKLTLESVHANRARHFKNKGTLRRVK